MVLVMTVAVNPFYYSSDPVMAVSGRQILRYPGYYLCFVLQSLNMLQYLLICRVSSPAAILSSECPELVHDVAES